MHVCFFALFALHVRATDSRAGTLGAVIVARRHDRGHARVVLQCAADDRIADELLRASSIEYAQSFPNTSSIVFVLFV